MPSAQRTLIQIAIDAGSELGLFGNISSLALGSTEARLMGSALNQTARDCIRAGLLVREFSFYTVSGTESYALPSDYYLPWTDTTWNTSDQWPLQNVSQKRWQSDRSGFVASSVHQRYRIIPLVGGGTVDGPGRYSLRRMHIDPTPTSAEQIVFNYRSDHWCEPSADPDVVDNIVLSGSDAVVIKATSHGLTYGAVLAFRGTTGATELNHNIYTVSATTTDTFTLLGTSSADFVTSGTAVAIEGVTLAGSNPVQIAATGHGLSNGDQVKFSSVGGTTELNGNSYIVESVAADTFDLTGTDSSNFSTWTSGGTYIAWSPTGRFIALQNRTGSGTALYSLLPEDLVERGLVYRLRRTMGMSYFDHKAEYDDLLAAYKGALHGDHVINLGSGGMGRSIGIPDGNFTTP